MLKTIFVPDTPCFIGNAKWQTANLLHGNLTPPRYSPSCVQAYHYPLDPLRPSGLLTGLHSGDSRSVLRLLRVPATLALVKIYVLAFGLFSFQGARMGFPAGAGINPFTYLDKQGTFFPHFPKNFIKNCKKIEIIFLHDL